MSPTGPGVRLTRAQFSLLASKITDWRAFVPLHSSFYDSGEIISLGDEYFVSLGAHALHGVLLMDRAATVPLSLERSLSLSALLAFSFDTIVLPLPSSNQRLPVARARETNREMARVVRGGLDGYFQSLSEVAEALEEAVVSSGRDLRPCVPQRNGWWAHVALPKSEMTWRLLSVYLSGLLSPTPVGRLLNFWRVFEAGLSRPDRESVFSTLGSSRVMPVSATKLRILSDGSFRQRRVNRAAVLRRRAINRHDELVDTHGNDAAALSHLFRQRRGKAAHADQTALEYDQTDLAAQFLDCELVKYLARIALERSWS